MNKLAIYVAVALVVPFAVGCAAETATETAPDPATVVMDEGEVEARFTPVPIPNAKTADAELSFTPVPIPREPRLPSLYGWSSSGSLY